MVNCGTFMVVEDSYLKKKEEKNREQRKADNKYFDYVSKERENVQ